jgi:hypothetical protein
VEARECSFTKNKRCALEALGKETWVLAERCNFYRNNMHGAYVDCTSSME